jgi:phosphate/sulfate permease
MQRHSMLVLVLAGLLAIFVGYVNVTASEMQAIIGVLLIAGFALGALEPRQAWRWALLLGAAVFLSGAIAYLLAIPSPAYLHARAIHPELPPTEPFSDTLESLIAFIPAFVAVYLGVIARKIVEMVWPRTPSHQS